MRDQRQVVRVVADEFRNHVPLWFPSPIFDDESQMPLSPTLIQELRRWNTVSAAREDPEGSSSAEIAEHYRIGLELARRVAQELGSEYEVELLMAGDSGGWRHVEP